MILMNRWLRYNNNGDDDEDNDGDDDDDDDDDDDGCSQIYQCVFYLQCSE